MMLLKGKIFMTTNKNGFSKFYEKHKRLYDISLIILVTLFVGVLVYIVWMTFIALQQTDTAGKPLESETATLNHSCEYVYTNIRSGKINNTMHSNDGTLASWAADENDSISAKEEAARKVTLKQVQIYNGTDIPIEDMYYTADGDTSQNISKGQILAVLDNEDKPEGLVLIPLSEDTTLGDLYE